MNRSLIVVLLLVLVVGVGGYLFFARDTDRTDAQESVTTNQNENSASQNSDSSQTPPVQENPTDVGGEGFGIDAGVDAGVSVGSAALVSFTGNAYSPSTIRIKKGQTVRFVNNSDVQTWPASANHPNHTVYPEDREGQCLGSAFDACRGLKTGESWDFTFNTAGTWGFHDHLHSSIRGVVVVE